MRPKVIRTEIKVTRTMATVLAGLLVALALLAMPSAGAHPPLEGPGGQGGVTVASSVPTMINYQGQLLDSGGNLVPDGAYSMTFKLYRMTPEGEPYPFWEETHPNVQVTDGLLNVLLGEYVSLRAIDPEGEIYPIDPLYLGVTVGSDPEMTPRQRMVSVPFAFRAEIAEQCVNADNDWDYTTNPPHMYSIPTGNVGIGTTSPGYKLHVVGSTRLENPVGNPGPDALYAFQDSGIGRAGQFLISNSSNSAPVLTANTLGIGPILDLQKNGITKVIVTNDGNVGIGTGTPSERLDVNGRVRVRDLPQNNGLDDIVVADTSGVLHTRNASTLGGADADWYDVATGNPPTSILDDIYTHGKVGIGTTSPGQKLDVKGDIILGGSTGAGGPVGKLWFRNDAGNTEGWIHQEQNAMKFGGTNSYYFNPNVALQVGNSPSLMVRTDLGRVGIGTTSPQSTLQIEGSPGYLQIDSITTPPNPVDCTTAAHIGRMILQDPTHLWVCTSLGWKDLDF